EGFHVAMVARNFAKLAEHQRSLQQDGITGSCHIADAADPDALAGAIDAVQSEHGGATVAVYNVANIKWKSLLEETAASLVDDFRVNVAGALTMIRAVLPAMRQVNSGTILLTSSMFATKPIAGFGSLSIGKAGIRSLAYSLAGALKDTGIHVATLTIQGQVKPDDAHRSPEVIADACWRLNGERPGEFSVEIDI
ncbi:MAG: SDR family NAD(P)-dependent oxidoreductase, partial [Gammaproteobacteria bacterium]